MADAVIGALRVVLGADTGQLEDDLKRASSGLSTFAKKMGEVAAGIQFQKVVEAVFRSVIDTVNKAIDVGDKFSKASDRFGIPGDRLLLLAQAAELSEVSLDALGTSLTRLSRSMVNVAGGGTDQAASAFAALGISVKDASGKLKTGEQVLLEVATAFTTFDNAEQKAALAMAIFGKQGASLIPFLNQGAAGIKKLTDEFTDLGLVVGKDVLKTAEQFRDTQTRVGQAVTVVTLKLLGSSGLLDAMRSAAQATLELVAASDKLFQALSVLSPVWKVIVTSFELGVTQLKIIITPLRAVIDGLYEFSKSGIVLGIGAVVERFRQLGTIISDLPDRIKNIWKSADPGTDKLVAEAEEFLAIYDRIRLNIPRTFDPDAAKKVEAFNDKIKSLNSSTLDLLGTNKQLAPGFLEAAGGLKLLEGQIGMVEGRITFLGAKALELNTTMKENLGAKLVAEIIPAWDLFFKQVEGLDILLKTGKIGVDQYWIAWAVGSAQAIQQLGQTLSFAAGGFAILAKENKKFAVAAKAASIATAIINTYTAATKALTATPWLPVNLALAAATIVAGLGYVAQASAQNFATGGSFRVPGGSTSTDSKFVPLMLSPGEQVDITPSGRSGRGTTSTPTEITMNVRGRDRFTGDDIRELFAAINQGTSDGYRLKIGTA